MRKLILLILIFSQIGCGCTNRNPQSKTENDRIIEKLKPLIKPRTLLTLQNANDKNNSQFISHFGGIPYFEEGEIWPINTKTGQPLSFIFQIVNNDGIELPKEIAILQFYYDWEEMPWNTDEPGFLVKTYSSLDHGKTIQVKPGKGIEQTNYCKIIFSKDKSLPDWEGITELDLSIFPLSEKVNPDEPWEVYDNVVTELIGEQDYESYIGGYPKWIQGESTPIYNGKRYKLLCQIDSEDKANIMWGDSGAIYFFYNPDEPTEIEFNLQCY